MAQEKDMQELYLHMAEWHRFQRRDTDNIFNALFYDKENLATDEIMEFVQGTARFFDMPLPQVYDGCETFAKAVSRSMADYDICYNEKQPGLIPTIINSGLVVKSERSDCV